MTLARIPGLLDASVGGTARVAPDLRARIESLVTQRRDARRRRDFSEADRVRDELHRMGVVLEDTRDSTSWKLST